MKQNKQVSNMMKYSIFMALCASAGLVTLILNWYKVDHDARMFLFIPIIVGYAASIYAYFNRKPII